MKKTRKQIQKEESKARILTVSARLFRTKGYGATGIDQIMQEAGLTAGAFYSHFGSKEDLFEQSLAHALEYSRKLLTKDTENLYGDDKTNAVLKRYCSLSHRDFPEKGCVLPSLAAEIYRGTNTSKFLISDYIQKWADLIASHLAEELSAESRRDKALQLISRSVGAVLLSRMVDTTSLSEKILLSSQKI